MASDLRIDRLIHVKVMSATSSAARRHGGGQLKVTPAADGPARAGMDGTLPADSDSWGRLVDFGLQERVTVVAAEQEGEPVKAAA